MKKNWFLLFIFVFCSSVWASNESFKDIIHYLASDKLEGRKPGQQGNDLATKYLVSQFEKSGIRPLDNSYHQEFTIFTEMLKTGENSFSFDGDKAPFEPLSYSLSGDLNAAEVVFAGFGISIAKNDPNLKYDDYAQIDAKNKIVIVMTGDPGIGNKASKFRDPDYINYRSLFYKLKNAIAHGARGLILVNNPLSLENYPQEEPPYFNASEGGGSRFSIIAGQITNQFFNEKLSPGQSLINIQKKIAKTQKPASFSIKGTQTKLKVSLKKKTGRVANIVGVLEGSDDKLSREYIVIGAHMDHLGFGGESSMDPQGQGKIHNGADDNASGTAVVLKLANELKNLELKRSLVFVLFNAEEMGLLGSKHFVDIWKGRYEKSFGKMVGMLNFDMVGRYKKELSIMGTASAREWNSTFPTTPTGENYVLKPQDIGSSDHSSFIQKNIPALFFTTGAHEDYHRSTDTAEKINYTALKKLLAYSKKFIQNLDELEKISFNPNYSSGQDQGRGSRGYGAHLGCVPEFGQSDQIRGVVCVDISKDSPALKASVKPGDIITQIGDIEIKNIYDLAFALKYYRAGDQIELTWLSGKNLKKQMIILAKSKR
jgi:hypothetical protein